ncbi:N,N'-diacetylchitobiose transport system permease protein [Paenarthrobacter nitroguajacolicus]|uniref:carbohydrate ABC transporter permease n=1 Tax=Paenarthrobacter TaxID=1742992 RepID=UPI0028669620|nr:sugar ABC transporter permease [Paenarthrobacter nitroguajacolicus]MDR6988468.1 N,N'-diacetylchitobiose transport system permease protein [Paenarthrobacter nitroguajacolicus]
MTALTPVRPDAPQGAPGKGPTTAARKSQRFANGKRGLEPWLYLAPAFIVLIALLGYPIFQLINVSLYDYRQAQVSGKAPLNFVGLENYQKLFADPQFWTVLGNTVVFATACVVFTLLVGSSLAVLATRLRPWVRSLLFVVSLGAWATPAVTGSAVWLFLFEPTLGLVNKTLVAIGLTQFQGYSWTYDKWSAFGLVASEVVWCSFPFVLVTVYAGIQAIPTEVIEAARIDGASMPRIARSIMLPMLRPIVIVVTIQSIIWNFKIFSQIYIMTNGGGIAGQNLVLNVYGYQQAFAASLYGLGSALGVIMTALLMVITLVYLRILKRTGEAL